MVRIATSRKAGRLNVSPYPSPSGQVTPSWSSSVSKYDAQPCATTDAPSIISRSRSQPMIQATSSPMVA